MTKGIKFPNKLIEVQQMKKGFCFLYKGKPYRLLEKKLFRRKIFTGTHCLCECKDGSSLTLNGLTEVYPISNDLYEIIQIRAHAGSK